MESRGRRPHRLELGLHYRNPLAGVSVYCLCLFFPEILISFIRFNPIFVLPVSAAGEQAQQAATPSSPITRTPGRRTGTGSAAISSPAARAPTPRVPILGFRQTSLFGMLRATGHVPSAVQAHTTSSDVKSLEEIRGGADRPVVVFPECTTSNGRGLLRFAELFRDVSVPLTKFKVFIMCVRWVLRYQLSASYSLLYHAATTRPLHSAPH